MHQVKNNQPIMQVNLESLKNNYLLARSLVSKSVACAAVLKANAYGIGAKELFKTLSKLECTDYFFAYPEEAYALKDQFTGYEKIYIFNPQTKYELKDSLKYNYIPMLSSFGEIENFKAVCKLHNKNYPCTLHFDTGLNRLGINMNEIEKLSIDDLNVTYLSSHMSCADDPNNPHNQQQLNKMKFIAQKFPNIDISFANSAGIYLGKDYHFNQVRPGCMLYGINPIITSNNLNKNISCVVSIYAKIVRVKELDADEFIGYGATAFVEKGAKIATASIGYADGYLRALSNIGFCFAFGQKLPIIGRVSMDLVMIDVGKLNHTELLNLDYVEMMGENITVDEIAKSANTIGYEILTSLQSRFNRFYI